MLYTRIDGIRDIRSIKQWASFSTVFPAVVVIALIFDALLHGSSAHVVEVVMISFAGTLIWIGAFYQRRRFPKFADFLRYFVVLFLYVALYKPIHGMITAVRPGVIDTILLRIDFVLFGTNPIAWLGAIASPLLTDMLSLAYVSYYFGMPVLLILMWHRNGEREFRTAISAMMIGWYGALITYALFPALGPARFVPNELARLTGSFPSTDFIHWFLETNLTPAVRDCVPSMHTGVTLLTLIYGFRYQRAFFWIFLLPGIGVIAATMYLQQHYVVDVILGVMAAGLIYSFTQRVLYK